MRTQYDRWLAHQFTNGAFKHLDAEGEEVPGRVEARSEDFVAGLEGLDLSDFEVVGRGESQRGKGRDENLGGDEENEEDEAEREDEDESSWRRDCRCGGEFTIRESQLEKSADRGESEVVVGCKNCSLWVRVAFGVEGD
jgi:diphthamide biosynthesis protein 4